MNAELANLNLQKAKSIGASSSHEYVQWQLDQLREDYFREQSDPLRRTHALAAPPPREDRSRLAVRQFNDLHCRLGLDYFAMGITLGNAG